MRSSSAGSNSMRSVGRAYAVLVRAALLGILEYRAQALLWLVEVMFPLVMLAAWLAIVSAAGSIAGWTGPDFISYYVAAALANKCTSTWVASQWMKEINNGELAVKLLKPLDPFHQVLGEQLGAQIFVYVIGLPILAVLPLVLPAVHFPIGLAAAFFVLSVVLGYLLNVAMGTVFGLLAFWSPQTNTLYGLWVGVGQVLSGWVAPLLLFPTSVQQVAALLPFRGLLGFPVSLITGRLSGAAIAFGFAVDAVWIGVFFALARLLWTRGLRRYDAVGA